MQTTSPSKVNGVDTGALMNTVEAIQADPKIAKFQFRARNHLIDGGLNRSEIGEFHGALKEHRCGVEPFVLHNDEPAVLHSADRAPNPVEYLLQALLACITTTTTYKAAAHGIEIESIRSEVEGDIDLQGLLGLNPDVRPGFQEIRATLRIKAKDGVDDRIREFYKSSPVFDTLSNPVPVKVQVILEQGDELAA